MPRGFDPERRVKIVAAEMESQSDYDPYEGWECTGLAGLTMSRGDVLVRDGRLQMDAGRGSYMGRRRYQTLCKFRRAGPRTHVITSPPLGPRIWPT